MKSAEGSYPHPVVGNADDVDSLFQPVLYVSNDRKSLKLEFEQLDANNPTLSGLVREGKASYVARVDCDNTGFRQSYRLHGAKQTVEVPLEVLSKSVQVEICAIALSQIGGYHPVGAHPDYDQQSFEIQPGELLAVTGSYRFEIGTEWDPLKAPVQSLMEIVRGEDDVQPMNVDFEGDRIRIALCGPDFDSYNLRKRDSADVIHSAIVFPVLVSALEKTATEDYQGLLWTQRLVAILQAKEIPADEPLRAAQLLLERPVNRGLTCLDMMFQEGDAHE